MFVILPILFQIAAAAGSSFPIKMCITGRGSDDQSNVITATINEDANGHLVLQTEEGDGQWRDKAQTQHERSYTSGKTVNFPYSGNLEEGKAYRVALKSDEAPAQAIYSQPVRQDQGHFVPVATAPGPVQAPVTGATTRPAPGPVSSSNPSTSPATSSGARPQGTTAAGATTSTKDPNGQPCKDDKQGAAAGAKKDDGNKGEKKDGAAANRKKGDKNGTAAIASTGIIAVGLAAFTLL